MMKYLQALGLSLLLLPLGLLGMYIQCLMSKHDNFKKWAKFYFYYWIVLVIGLIIAIIIHDVRG